MFQKKVKKLKQLQLTTDVLLANRSQQVSELSPTADLEQRFLNAIVKGHVPIIEHCLDEGVDPNVHFGDKVTPLQYAVEMDNPTVVQLLLQNPNTRINTISIHGNTPLNYACRYGYERVASMLLQYGANIKFRDNFGNTPLHNATVRGSHDIVSILLEHGAQPNVTNSFGITPLYIAICELPNMEIVKLLLKHEADVNYYDPGSTMTLLMEACLFCRTFEQISMIELLLEKGARVNERTQSTYRTALHIAAFTGNQNLIFLLLKYNASTNKKDIKGDIPLSMALNFGNQHTADMLAPHSSATDLDPPSPADPAPSTSLEQSKFLNRTDFYLD